MRRRGARVTAGRAAVARDRRALRRGRAALAAVGAVGTVAAVAAACGDGAGRGRTLVVHASLPAEVLEHAEAAFEAAHPDVDVRIVEASPRETLEALGAGAAVVDVWWGAPGTLLETAAGRGLLAPQRPAGVSGGAAEPWRASLTTPFVIAFNREEVPLLDAPRDWIDLFHHAFAEEMVLLDPASSPEMGYFLGAMLVEALRDDDDLLRGFDWTRRLDGATGGYVREEPDVLRRLGSGDALLTILPRAAVERARHDDAPWLHYRIAESGAPVLARGIAIPARAPEPELARAFVELTETAEVATLVRLHTRWDPVHGAVDPARLPEDFELPAGPWRAFPLATDTIARELDGWIDRWELEVRGRGP